MRIYIDFFCFIFASSCGALGTVVKRGYNIMATAYISYGHWSPINSYPVQKRIGERWRGEMVGERCMCSSINESRIVVAARRQPNEQRLDWRVKVFMNEMTLGYWRESSSTSDGANNDNQPCGDGPQHPPPTDGCCPFIERTNERWGFKHHRQQTWTRCGCPLADRDLFAWENNKMLCDAKKHIFI